MKRMRLSLDETIDVGVVVGAERVAVAAAAPPPATSVISSENGRHWWPGAWETVDPEAERRERNLLSELTELRVSIERLRREREEAIGQFHALIRPMVEPIPDPPTQLVEPTRVFEAAAGLKPCATVMPEPCDTAPEPCATVVPEPCDTVEALPESPVLFVETPKVAASRAVEAAAGLKPCATVMPEPCATEACDTVSPWELENPLDPLSGFGHEESAGPIDTVDERPPADEFEELARRVREINLHRSAPKPLPRRRTGAARFRFAAASLAAIAVSGSLATARTPLPIGRHEAVRRLVPSPWDGRLLAAWSTVVALRPASAAPRAEAPVPSRPLPFDPASVKPAWVQAGMVGTTAKATKSRLEQAPAPLGAGDGETEDHNP